MRRQIKINYYRGQGLLETVVAIGVIVTGLVGVMALVISSVVAERAADMRLQALNFAREGIEAVKNIRDSNWLADRTAWDGIASDGELKLIFDPDTGERSLTDTENDTHIYQDADGVYLQGVAGAKTAFSRVIKVADIKCQDLQLSDLNQKEACGTPDTKIGIKVAVIVSWPEKGAYRQEVLNENLYDWR